MKKHLNILIHLINLKWGVSGCPRSCVESGVKDFGVISVENGYQIFIGGNGGTDVTVGKLLTTVETEDEVIQLCGALMQYYRNRCLR